MHLCRRKHFPIGGHILSRISVREAAMASRVGAILHGLLKEVETPMLILTLSNRIRVSLVALLVCLPAMMMLPAPARAQQKSAEEIDRQVEAMLSKLTLEQKIGLIHGTNGMFNPPMPQIGLPPLKPSDGPM